MNYRPALSTSLINTISEEQEENLQSMRKSLENTKDRNNEKAVRQNAQNTEMFQAGRNATTEGHFVS